MGRQVQISVLLEDVEGLFAHIKSQHRVVLVKRDDSDSATVESLESLPANETLILWNQEILPQLTRRRINREAAGYYYRVDEFAQPVLEFGGSFLGQWCGRPSLTQGRIYGIFDNKSQDFVRWYEQIVRYIRKAFVRNPANLSGYVGPAAYKWFLQGGLLLPTFLPPETEVWRKFFADEELIRVRLKETSDTETNFTTDKRPSRRT
jgi:hypothetical protein